MKKLLFIVAIIIVTSNFGYSQADVSSNTNLNEVSIDDLTDEQIATYLEQARQSGLSEQQLLLLAKQRGLTDAQVKELRNRISNLGAGGSNQTALNEEGIKRLRSENQGENKDSSFDIFDSFTKDGAEETQEQQKDSDPHIFGSEIFQNINLNFEPSLNTPTPQNYQIGPGDEMIIDIWGASEQSYILDVSPDGLIKIPSLGPIYINGLSVEQASQKVKRRLSKIYSGLYSRNGEEPNTYFQLSLGSLRSIKVNVIGEVVYPGSYTLSSFSNMFNAIYYAGGPNQNGSMRNIELIRGNEKIGKLDIYDYLINGKLTNNEKLQDQDVILIHPYTNRVTVGGEVKRPAIYETEKTETLSALIKYSGGFNERAYRSKLLVKRNTEKAKEVLTVDQNDLSAFEMQNGDQVTVKGILDKYNNRVRITGAVNMPGEYQLEKGLTLRKLIEYADGLREDAFTGRGLIVRLNSDLTLSNLSFNVGDMVSGTTSDIALMKEDVIKISSIFDLQEAKTLSIRGEVLKEGIFPFIEGMTVEDLLVLSGGLKESASKSIVEVARRMDSKNEEVLLEIAQTFDFAISDDLRLSGEASDFLLEPYDIVTIRRTPGFTKQVIVEVQGEVKYPGKYVLQIRNEKISDVIKRAGGLTRFAYSKGARLLRRTEFYGNSEDKTVEAKKESIQAVVENDTLVRSNLVRSIEEKEFEPVGIDLVEILSNPKSIGDISLQEGDILSIPRQPETVRIHGEVLYPSVTRYQANHTLKEYLSYAGGVNDHARSKKAFVIYPNGSALQTKNFLWIKNYPKIEPGSEIIVPRRPERRRLTIQEILGIVTSVTTIAFLVDRLGN